MLLKSFAAVLLGATLFAAPAMAENAKAPPPNSAAQSNSAAQPTQMNDNVSVNDLWRGSKLIGLNVYNDQNKKIGDINELLLDQQGKIDMVVIGVGGFLGMGEHSVAVKFSELKWANEPVRTSTTTSANPPSTTTGEGTTANASTNRNYPDHAVLNATKEQLKAMPEVKYGK
jgi:PRC-barrel domain